MQQVKVEIKYLLYCTATSALADTQNVVEDAIALILGLLVTTSQARAFAAHIVASISWRNNAAE